MLALEIIPPGFIWQLLKHSDIIGFEQKDKNQNDKKVKERPDHKISFYLLSNEYCNKIY